MPRRPKIIVVATRKGFKVETPATLSVTGKRVRNYFSDEKDAQKHARALRKRYHELGTKAGALDPADSRDAVKALNVLAPWGKTLTEAATAYADTLEREEASVPFGIAADQWLEEAEGELRSSTAKSYRYTVQRLRPHLESEQLSNIASDQIEKALKTKGATSYAMHRRNARALWNWAAKRGWCKPEVFDTVASPRKIESGEIEVLKPADVRALLKMAEKRYPEIVLYYTLALFAGLRAAEIQRIDPAHVQVDGIELPASVSKTGRRRHIPMNRTLKAWIGEYPFVRGSNYKEKDRACRRLAGWSVASRLIEHDLPDDAPLWPQNAFRHTHASAAVAAGVTLEQLLFSFGHSGGPDLLQRHYVGRYPKRDADAFWRIGPGGKKLNRG